MVPGSVHTLKLTGETSTKYTVSRMNNMRKGRQYICQDLPSRMRVTCAYPVLDKDTSSTMDNKTKEAEGLGQHDPPVLPSTSYQAAAFQIIQMRKKKRTVVVVQNSRSPAVGLPR